MIYGVVRSVQGRNPALGRKQAAKRAAKLQSRRAGRLAENTKATSAGGTASTMAPKGRIVDRARPQYILAPFPFPGRQRIRQEEGSIGLTTYGRNAVLCAKSGT